MSGTIRIATRGSVLALTQTRQTVDLLKKRNPRYAFEIVTLKTLGDKVTDRPLNSFRGVGVFVKELQQALYDERADIAVHSLKDVPVDQPEGLVLEAFAPRAEVHDIALTKNAVSLDALEEGACIGTSSPRRIAQLKAYRGDFTFKDLRGNLDTRIRKLQEGDYDAIVVAAAGMRRLGIHFSHGSRLPLEICLPAAGQGAIGLECRSDDGAARALCGKLNCEATGKAVHAERAFLKSLGGGCAVPAAAHGVIEQGDLFLRALVGEPHTGRIVRAQWRGAPNDVIGAGQYVANELLERCRKEGLRIDADN